MDDDLGGGLSRGRGRWCIHYRAYNVPEGELANGPYRWRSGLPTPDAMVEEAVSWIWHRQPLLLQHLPHHMYGWSVFLYGPLLGLDQALQEFAFGLEVWQRSVLVSLFSVRVLIESNSQSVTGSKWNSSMASCSCSENLTGELVAAATRIIETSECSEAGLGIKGMAGLEKTTGSDGKLLGLEVDEAVTRGSEDRDTISGVELDVAVVLDAAAPFLVTDFQWARESSTDSCFH